MILFKISSPFCVAVLCSTLSAHAGRVVFNHVLLGRPVPHVNRPSQAVSHSKLKATVSDIEAVRCERYSRRPDEMVSLSFDAYQVKTPWSRTAKSILGGCSTGCT